MKLIMMFLTQPKGQEAWFKKKQKKKHVSVWDAVERF